MKEAHNAPNLYVPESDKEHAWAVAAFSFYKSSKFNSNVVLILLWEGSQLLT